MYIDEKNKGKTIFECRDTTIEFTNDQTEALKKVEIFLSVSDEFFFLLAGFSGCGKTTIAENIVKYCNANVLAPTNTAVNRLREKIKNSKGSFTTIHSCLFSPTDDTGGFKKEKSFERERVYVIDEVSMIDQYVLNVIIQDAIERKVKVIFLGDSFQLEPIGTNPKIFDWEKSYPEHFLMHNKYELQEVKRYDGSLLKIATELRTKQKAEVTLGPDSDLLPVAKFTKLLGSCIAKNSSYAVLTSTNKMRVMYNRMIRNHRYKDVENLSEFVQEGERLISISNSSFYSNGEIFEMKNWTYLGDITMEIHETKPKVKSDQTSLFEERKNPNVIKTLIFKVYKGPGSNDWFSPTPMFLFSPNIEEPSFHGPTLVNAFKEGRLKGNKNLIKQFIKSKEVKQRYMNGPMAAGTSYYFNKDFTIVTFGYALSVHKAQGNEWDYVFIDAPWLMDVWNEAKWFYTAITRAKKKVELKPTRYINLKKE